MAARFEVTKKYAQAYAAAPRKGKSVILDHVVEVTGWNRDHARQQLVARLQQAPGRAVATVAVIDRRKTKPRKYSYDAIKVLQQVWATAGGSCGKYLAVAMTDWLDAMETEGSLVSGQDRYSAEVRAELESMSAATIDRYLAPARATDPLRGKSATRPGSLLRNSIQIRKAGDEVEAEPGFFEVDTVAHCGPTLQGEFARSVNFTDMHTGWTFTHAIRNNAHIHIRTAFDLLIEQVPFAVTGIDSDNGSEFINHQLIDWAGQRDVFFTRSRPYKKNDQATIERWDEFRTGSKHDFTLLVGPRTRPPRPDSGLNTPDPSATFSDCNATRYILSHPEQHDPAWDKPCDSPARPSTSR